MGKEAPTIGGNFHRQGRDATGRLDGPTFAGLGLATNARYGTLYWDELEADVTYSPDQLHLVRGRVQLGLLFRRVFELMLELDGYGFNVR